MLVHVMQRKNVVGIGFKEFESYVLIHTKPTIVKVFVCPKSFLVKMNIFVYFHLDHLHPISDAMIRFRDIDKHNITYGEVVRLSPIYQSVLRFDGIPNTECVIVTWY